MPWNLLFHTGQWSLVVYAILLGVGGLIGFKKAGSRPSLIAGLSSAVVALICFGFTYDGGMGIWFGLLLAIAMTVVFALRYRKTRKFMPSGMLLAVTVAEGLLLALALVALFKMEIG